VKLFGISSLSVLATALLVLLAGPVGAQESAFKPGPLIPEYGHIAAVEGTEKLPAGVKFKVAMDATKRSEGDKVNAVFERTARFLNMHVAAGVPAENIKMAVVVHGSAVMDVTSDSRYGSANPNAKLVKLLQANGVTFYVCGQAAAYHEVTVKDLMPGVKMSISAMTAHALLQQQGYTLNP